MVYSVTDNLLSSVHAVTTSFVLTAITHCISTMCGPLIAK